MQQLVVDVVVADRVRFDIRTQNKAEYPIFNAIEIAHREIEIYQNSIEMSAFFYRTLCIDHVVLLLNAKIFILNSI